MLVSIQYNYKNLSYVTVSVKALLYVHETCKHVTVMEHNKLLPSGEAGNVIIGNATLFIELFFFFILLLPECVWGPACSAGVQGSRRQEVKIYFASLQHI